MVQMPMGLKRNQIRSQEPAQDFLAMREQRKNFRRRKWDMQKEADTRLRELFAEQAGQEQQMVIMNPDEIAWSVNARYSLGKRTVAFEVRSPCFFPEAHPIGKVMKQGPQRLIGISFVKLVG